MAEKLSLAAVILSFFIFGAIGVAVGERWDKSGKTNNSSAVLVWIFGGVGALVVGVVLRQLGYW